MMARRVDVTLMPAVPAPYNYGPYDGPYYNCRALYGVYYGPYSGPCLRCLRGMAPDLVSARRGVPAAGSDEAVTTSPVPPASASNAVGIPSTPGSTSRGRRSVRG
jgi:hypothetical protein